MIGYRLPLRARRTRLVAVADDLVVTLYEDPGSYFAATVVPPAATGGGAEGAPRDNAARSRLVYSVEQELAAASRIEIYNGIEYELLADPRPLRLGTKVGGFEVEVLAVTELYPRAGELTEQGGTALSSAEPVPCAVYQPDEAAGERGSWETWRGEAPIEHAEALNVKNRSLVFDDVAYKIRSATTNFEVPHVALDLVKAG